MLSDPVYIDLEGADLTGKSTLLKSTFHEGEYSKIMCFHDRGILTHFVYNKEFKRYIEDLTMWMGELVKFVKKNGIIILVASEEELTRRHSLRSDDCFKLGQILQINEAYVTIYGKFLCDFENVRLIYVDKKTPFEIYEEAKSLYQEILEKSDGRDR
jgi:thymidylate kinase